MALCTGGMNLRPTINRYAYEILYPHSHVYVSMYVHEYREINVFLYACIFGINTIGMNPRTNYEQVYHNP
jgi:hypothetical protein